MRLTYLVAKQKKIEGLREKNAACKLASDKKKNVKKERIEYSCEIFLRIIGTKAMKRICSRLSVSKWFCF